MIMPFCLFLSTHSSKNREIDTIMSRKVIEFDRRLLVVEHTGFWYRTDLREDCSGQARFASSSQDLGPTASCKNFPVK